jgi:hypothetical protein
MLVISLNVLINCNIANLVIGDIQIIRDTLREGGRYGTVSPNNTKGKGGVSTVSRDILKKNLSPIFF